MSLSKKNKKGIIFLILLVGCVSIYVLNRYSFKEMISKSKKKETTTATKTTDPATQEKPEASVPASDSKQTEIGSDAFTSAMEQAPVKVKVLRAYRMNYNDYISLIGIVRGFTEINLQFQTKGIVDKLFFHEGESVKKGDIIASIDKKEAELKYQYNELEYKKNLKMYEAGAINRSALRKAELEFESAVLELEKTDLIAPCNGVIAKMLTDEGNVAEEVGILLNTDYVWVELSVIEQDIQRVNIGQRIELSVDAFPDRIFHSIVNRISQIVEGSSRTITAKTRVDNIDGLLYSGMFARAKLFTHESVDVIIVPGSALKDLDQDGVFDSVFVVDENNIIRARSVVVSYVSMPPANTYAEIEQGLEPGDLVVVYEPSPENVKDEAQATILDPIFENVDLTVEETEE